MLPPVAAVAIQLALWRFVDPHVWFLFYPAVFISSWIGGSKAGLWATGISVTAVWWLFIPPRYSFATKYLTALFPAGVFVSTGVLFSLFHDRLRQSNQRAIEALRALRAANEEIRRLYEETKRSRDSLSEKEVRLRIFAALVDNSSDFIGIADTSGKPVYVNPAGRRMVGLSPDYPVEDTQIPDFYPPDLRAFVSNVIVNSMNEQGFWRGETCFRHWQTQEAIPVSDEHFTIREPETGRLLGLGTITRDITERRRTEEALRLSEAKFAGIYSVSADAIISVDETQRITMFNEGAESIFGHSRPSIIGSPLEILFPERFREAHRQHVERVRARARTRHVEWGRGAPRSSVCARTARSSRPRQPISRLRGRRHADCSPSPSATCPNRARIEDEERLLAETRRRSW